MTGPERLDEMPPNPFVGPKPIEKGQPIFGRDLEIAQLYDLLYAERIVLLYSARFKRWATTRPGSCGVARS